MEVRTIKEILGNVASVSVLGCAALFLIRKGPVREILQIALGIVLALSVILPIISRTGSMKEPGSLWEGKIELAREKQEAIYIQALTEQTEEFIQRYFSEREMRVDAFVKLQDGVIESVILCPQETYDWTQEDTAAFSSWSGIAEERQEWVWN